MDVLLIIVAVLAVVHIIECIFFREKIMASPHGKFLGFILTMIFGIFYLRRLDSDKNT
jgi:uncharacterized protein YhhL (DUF1145 family)